MTKVPVEKMFALMESNGWTLMRIWGKYRVFMRSNLDTPIVIEVFDGKVRKEDLDYVIDRMISDADARVRGNFDGKT